MDPYIERRHWPTFHGRIIAALMDALVQALRPRYAVFTEERIYLEHSPDDGKNKPPFILPDLMVAETKPAVPYGSRSGAAVLDPISITLPVPEKVKERYLIVESMETKEVVTIIEVLSPSNKRAGSDGVREYLAKRDAVLMSWTNLIEIDLLRGGLRLPAEKPLPPCDYCAIVSRATQRPSADAYCWSVRDPLPTIPIPLAPEDMDVMLSLQEVFTTVYDRAGYDYSLDYRGEVEPPLGEEDREWVAGVLAGREVE
jgi:hypothetical protein